MTVLSIDTRANTHFTKRVQFAALFASAATMLVAIAVLAGWALQIESLKRIFPGLVAMNPATAIAFIFCGSAIMLSHRSAQSAVACNWARVLALAITSIGLLRLAGYSGGWEVGVDQLLFTSALMGEALTPNRMAPNTALNFVLVGAALLCMNMRSRRTRIAAQFPAIVASLISLLALIGYGYSTSSLYGIGSFIPMALHTAACFMFVSLAILASRPHDGVVSLITSESLGGVLARRLLPVVVVAPAALGWICIWGARLDFYDTTFAVSLFVVGITFLFLAIVWWTALLLHRGDEKRRHSELALYAAKAEAEAASQAKSTFLANMSHEIRTPLNGVIGMTDLILGTSLTDQQRRYVSLIKSSAESLGALISDILDVSKIEAGKIELESRDFDLHPMVEDVIQMLAQKAAAKKLELACHFHPQAPRLVRGDPERLRQILVNLVNNALKFTERGSVIVNITVDEIRDRESVVRFAVSDTGIGIPADRVDRLFKAFSQVDASTTRRFGGTGLGLVISKQLAELMGGSIGVESELGRGSTFWFTVRLEVQIANAIASGIDNRITRIRVLAVDDNPTICETLRQQITSWGLTAETATDADEALIKLNEAVAEEAPFQLAIIDSELHGSDGFDLARKIKSQASIAQTVLMVLLNLESEYDHAELKKAGFAGHMTKPVRQSQLFDAIMNTIAAASGKRNRSVESASVRGHAERARSQHPGARILLVEDNEVNQIVAREILTAAGYVCEVASNGSEAVESVRKGHYDLVVMDCQMPGMDGFEATQVIRRWEQDRSGDAKAVSRIPIVALTANAIKGDREKCLAAGMDAYTSKPVNAVELIRTIDSLVGLSPSGESKRPTADVEDRSASRLTAEPTQEPPFDIERLLERCMDNVSIVTGVLSKFEEQILDNLRHLTSSIQAGNSAEVARIAHMIKGASGTMTAQRAAAVAGELEAQAREGDLENAVQRLQELRAEVDRCISHIAIAKNALQAEDAG